MDSYDSPETQTGWEKPGRETFAYSDAARQERVLTFMEAMEGGNTPFLAQLEKKALEAEVPIIRTQTQSLLKFILAARRPRQILEVGTATGFSALFMETYAPVIDAPAGKKPLLISIERDQDRYQEALANVQAAVTAGALDPESAARMDLRLGEAEDILPQLQGTFDFIFMDAAKGQYIHFLPQVMRLLSPGGILLSDNIFKDGEILESRFAVKRRDRTIHKRMREYIYQLTHDPSLQTLLLEEGDGAAVSVKKVTDCLQTYN